MSQSCWDILGIVRTTDLRLIKKQYADKLKLSRPEDDGFAFQRLREAYDEASKFARSGTSSCMDWQVESSESENEDNFSDNESVDYFNHAESLKLYGQNEEGYSYNHFSVISSPPLTDNSDNEQTVWPSGHFQPNLTQDESEENEVVELVSELVNDFYACAGDRKKIISLCESITQRVASMNLKQTSLFSQLLLDVLENRQDPFFTIIIYIMLPNDELIWQTNEQYEIHEHIEFFKHLLRHFSVLFSQTPISEDKLEQLKQLAEVYKNDETKCLWIDYFVLYMFGQYKIPYYDLYAISRVIGLFREFIVTIRSNSYPTLYQTNNVTFYSAFSENGRQFNSRLQTIKELDPFMGEKLCCFILEKFKFQHGFYTLINELQQCCNHDLTTSKQKNTLSEILYYFVTQMTHLNEQESKELEQNFASIRQTILDNVKVDSQYQLSRDWLEKMDNYFTPVPSSD